VEDPAAVETFELSVLVSLLELSLDDDFSVLDVSVLDEEVFSLDEVSLPSLLFELFESAELASFL
jgi:hypothetical protein